MQLGGTFTRYFPVRGNKDAVIYFDGHYLKFRETFLDVAEKILSTLTKECEQVKQVPRRAADKEERNNSCSCGSRKKYKGCHGI